jgi:Ser/Thr protein kinase RdoA (MazF antagonist)
MRPFEALTHRGQIRRMRQIAERALPYWELREARLHFLQHAENTTFRVDAPPGSVRRGRSAHVPGRYLLRVHRPGYQDPRRVASEVAWLAALRHETDLPVPEPVPARGKAWIVEVAPPDGSPPRLCTLLRWIDGRFVHGKPQAAHFRRIGRLTAMLHNHSAAWKRPRAFERRQWNADGLFGDGGGFGVTAKEVWSLLPASARQLYRGAADQARRALRRLESDPEAWGLVHADLHFGNVLFAGGEARAIDFDDCGHAPWIYDFAVTLADHWDRPDWPDLRGALLEGYAEKRPLPDLTHLELLAGARLVAVSLWISDMARTRPRLRRARDRWLPWMENGVRHWIGLPAAARAGAPGRRRSRPASP